MYGYQKFMSYVESEREKHSILIREGRTTLWSYFAHCSAMCVLIALAVCNGPLLYDYTLIYKGSLDGTVLVQFNKVFLFCKIKLFQLKTFIINTITCTECNHFNSNYEANPIITIPVKSSNKKEKNSVFLKFIPTFIILEFVKHCFINWPKDVHKNWNDISFGRVIQNYIIAGINIIISLQLGAKGKPNL